MRITYDDANECFELPQNVRRIIRDIGGCAALPDLQVFPDEHLRLEVLLHQLGALGYLCGLYCLSLIHI